MKNKEHCFQKELIDLIEMICCYGINAIRKYDSLTFDELSNFLKENSLDFRSKCQEGWKKAQDIILTNQILFWKHDPKFKNNPEKLYWYRNYQRLMDVIIWNHFSNSDFTKMRRMYEEKPLIQNLVHHNIKSHYSLAKSINNDKRYFALVTDLTSGMRVGDLMIVSKNGIKFVEVKEGAVNKQIPSSPEEAV